MTERMELERIFLEKFRTAPPDEQEVIFAIICQKLLTTDLINLIVRMDKDLNQGDRP